MQDKDKLNREIIRGNIERDAPNLTDAAKEQATNFAMKIWKGDMGNGEASRIGIRHVTSDILKEEK